MRALVKTALGPGNVELVDVPEPEPALNEVKIKVDACGICGSDLHFYHGKGGSMSIFPPVTLGHEFSGVIVGKGKDVNQWEVGERVTSEPAVRTCGVCEFCMSGLPAHCSQRRSLGSGLNGAFAPYLVTTPNRLHRLPDNINSVMGAMVEPTACCVRAVIEQGQVKAGDVVLVTGPGPIGLLTAQVARAHGAYVILVGTQDDVDRLNIGRSTGIDQVLVIGQDDILNSVADMTGGLGVHAAFECSGAKSAVTMCLQALKRKGYYTQVAVFADPITVDFNFVGGKELNVRGSFGSTYTAWEKTLQLMAQGRINVEPLVTTNLPLGRWKEAFDLLEEKKACKAILRPI